jgi:hypothetical protein
MTIQIPESLAHDLEGIARGRNMTIEQVALDRLRLGGRPVEQLRLGPPGCDQPGDGVVLWRYMDLGKFLAMLRGERLYFNRLREFPDPWEGKLVAALAVYPHLDREVLKQLYAWCGRKVGVSCWHEGCGESVAMWRLYTAGAEGVPLRLRSVG